MASEWLLIRGRLFGAPGDCIFQVNGEEFQRFRPFGLQSLGLETGSGLLDSNLGIELKLERNVVDNIFFDFILHDFTTRLFLCKLTVLFDTGREFDLNSVNTSVLMKEVHEPLPNRTSGTTRASPNLDHWSHTYENY